MRLSTSIPLILFFVGGSMETAAAQEYEVIALRGSGGEGGLVDLVVFGTEPIMNAEGNVLYDGIVRGVGAGIWLWDRASNSHIRVMQKGDVIDQTVLGDTYAGQAVLADATNEAYLVVALSAGGSGLFHFDGAGAVTLLARDGDACPAGTAGTYQFFAQSGNRPVLESTGGIYLPVRCDVDMGLFATATTLERFPPIGTNVIAQSGDVITTEAMDNLQGQFLANPSGDVSFLSAARCRDVAWCPPPTSAILFGLMVRRDGVFSMAQGVGPLVGASSAFLSTELRIQTFDRVAMNSAGDLLYAAHYSGTGGANPGLGLFRERDGVPQLIVQEGDTVPVTEYITQRSPVGQTFGSLLGGPLDEAQYLTDTGHAFFTSLVDDGPEPSNWLFCVEPSGELKTIGWPGFTIGSTPETQLGNILQVTVSSAGRLAAVTGDPNAPGGRRLFVNGYSSGCETSWRLVASDTDVVTVGQKTVTLAGLRIGGAPHRSQNGVLSLPTGLAGRGHSMTRENDLLIYGDDLISLCKNCGFGPVPTPDEADLVVRLRDGASDLEKIQFTMSVTNLGGILSGISTVELTAPAGIRPDPAFSKCPSTTKPDGSLDRITCPISRIGAGMSANPILVSALHSGPGSYTFTASVASEPVDAVPENNHASITIEVGARYDLSVTIEPINDPDPLRFEPVGLDFFVTNLGEFRIGEVTLVIDSVIPNLSAPTVEQGALTDSCEENDLGGGVARRWTCSFYGFAGGETRVVRALKNSFEGTLGVTAVVSSVEEDPDLSNNTAEYSAQSQPTREERKSDSCACSCAIHGAGHQNRGSVLFGLGLLGLLFCRRTRAFRMGTVSARCAGSRTSQSPAPPRSRR